MSTETASGIWQPWKGVGLALREDGMTGLELAQKLGWEPSKVSRLINGKLKRIPIEELMAVAAAQNRNLSWYLHGPDRMTDSDRAMGLYLSSPVPVAA